MVQKILHIVYNSSGNSHAQPKDTDDTVYWYLYSENSNKLEYQNCFFK